MLISNTVVLGLLFVVQLERIDYVNGTITMCKTDKSELNTCHDGGCNYLDDSGVETCVCAFSKNVMKGDFCGIYEDMCQRNPCVNGGKCESGIGHYVCECPNGFYGVRCEIPVPKGKLFDK